MDRFSQKMRLTCLYDKCGLKFLSMRIHTADGIKAAGLITGLKIGTGEASQKHKSFKVWRICS